MRIVTTIPEARTALRALRPNGETLALVPTMGALHEGHLSLIRAARATCASVAVSIFVNPLQFGPSEDFAQYPRTFESDCAILERESVDLLFAPSAAEMYPTPNTTWVDVPTLAARLDGIARPGHFRGIATVVTKLFHIIAPTHAFFGQKDAAQVAVLRAMVRDLNFDLQLITCPTVRSPDGLALSSRNRYLTPADRTIALTLSQALCAVEQAALSPTATPTSLHQILLTHLQSAHGLALEYAEIVHPETLQPIANLAAGALVAIAARIGATRLIDNTVLPAPADVAQ